VTVTRTFADHVADYAQAGWPCILPVPPKDKFPPPVGFTGAEGRDTDPLQLVAWAGTHAGHSIALRMPEGVIGIDVDHYTKGTPENQIVKAGADTLASYAEQWGPLPPTWASTARGGDDGPGPSRILFYRVPPGRYATKLGADIDVIQRHHRYAVVWPSAHHEAGVYRWYAPDGTPSAVPPKPDEFPELPAAWVAGLADGAAGVSAASADRESGQILLDQLADDWRPECADVTSARLTAVEALRRSDSGSRHDTMTERTHHLVQLAASGHTGVAHALLELRDLWAEITAGEDRADEYERALLTSARKAVTVVGTVQVPNDPCLLLAGGFPLPPHVPSDPGDGEPDLQILEPPRWHGVRESIGTHAFDPQAGLDQALAEAVLARMYPALRYAYDAGAWLLRAPTRWELYKRLSPWAVAQLGPLMPVGDPTAEKGSEPYERAKRRARFMTAGGAGGIAKMVDSLVAGGMHPASIALADLDADPEILWAGGMPYSLRHSLTGPAFAQADVSTPHMHCAGVMPETRPTPLWDAFLAAVWPDPEVRRWAVRVLAISLTGYADRALPILLGETGRGKTQVVHLLMSVLGSYAHAANPKLLSSSTNEHDTIVFALKGRRLSFIDEAPAEAKAGQERLKQLTGGGELTARQMNQDPITFRPTHTLVLTANDEPVLTDPAIRARVRLIPCDGDPEEVAATRAAIGHVSGTTWRAEAPGVLAALMAEAAAWLADPSTAYTTAAPEHIRYLAETFGAEQDPVAMWVTEETEPSEEGTGSRELYQAFVASCRRNSMRTDLIPSETKWGRQLTRFGYPSSHSEHGKRRQLRLRTGGEFLPGLPVPSSGNAVQPDGLNRTADGFLTGSNATRQEQNSRSDRVSSVDPDGLTGSEAGYAHAHAHAHEAAPEADPTRQDGNRNSGADLRKQHPDGLADPVGHDAKPKPKRQQTEAAREKAARARAEKRAAAIAEAGGELLELPAVVTRDLVARSVALADADELLHTISGHPAGELTVDVETSGYPVGHEHYALRTVQLGGEHFTVVLDPTDPAQADVVRRHVAAAPVLHAHSATADLVPLAHAGLLGDDSGLEDAWERMHDTVIPAKLADPASTGSDPGLKKLSAAVLGEDAVSPGAEDAKDALFKAGKWLKEVKATTEPERSGWAQVDSRCATMVRYAAADVLDDAALARLLPQPPPNVLARERLAQRMTARVAYHGLRLDADHVAELQVAQRAALADAAARLAAFGVENPGSDQQVAAAVEREGLALPRTKTGRPSVASGVLEPHKGLDGRLGELVRARLDYQEAENRLGLFLDGYHLAVTRGDGRVRPTVYTMEAKTGRMSCVRPNLQQVPREGGFRACITADPGEVLISADFSGVELRVAAALSQDPNLMAIVADPARDIHREVAQIVWGPTAGKAERYMAKRKVFGRLYGSGINGLCTADPPVSEATARAIVDALDSMTPGLSAWSRMVADAIESGRTQFVTYSGRVIHMPRDRGYAGPNYCIQGTARELLIDALERWSRTRWGSCVLLPVHDELVVKVPESDAEEATRVLVECMASELAGVSIAAEPSEPSFAWADSV
jgi:P4 family phage/plasmid primase-like protien